MTISCVGCYFQIRISIVEIHQLEHTYNIPYQTLILQRFRDLLYNFYYEEIVQTLLTQALVMIKAIRIIIEIHQ